MCRDARGFSTLEIMIALAVMVISLTSVIEVVFGNERMLVQSQMNSEALRHADDALTKEEYLARQDFDLVDTVATTSDDVYQTRVTVDAWPQDLYTTKRLIAETGWQDERGVSHTVRLESLVTNYKNPAGDDTCSLPSTGTVGSTDYQITTGALLPWVAPMGHTFASNNPIAAIDAYQGRLYVAVASTSARTNDTLFIFDSSGGVRTPIYLGSSDNANNTTDGISAIRVSGKYAYVGSAHDPNFKTCKVSANCTQLQIFDISNPALIPAPTNYLIPTSTPPYVWGNVSSSNQAVGKSIAYANGYVYLGLSKTAHGPEFNIIDVHDTQHPVWVGGYSVGSTINAIVVRNGYAYLATDDSSQDVVVLDAHDVTNPLPVGTYDVPDVSGWANGKSLTLIGNRLYLGLTYATSSPELYQLDISQPFTVMPTASLDIGSSVVGIVAKGSQVYVVTSTSRTIQNVDASQGNMLATTSVQTIPGVASALDCERSVLYTTSNNAGAGYLTLKSI